MNLPIQLISTDFDGTLHTEFENPPVPVRLERLLGDLQRQGVKWVINTGRDLSSVMEALGRARLSIRPDYLVVVEREIYCHHNAAYTSLAEWNDECTRVHAEIFSLVRRDLARLIGWVQAHFEATVYEDAYSPFCLLAQNQADADAIHGYLEEYCRTIPDLTVMRNDVYARFAHVRFNKGSALAEIRRRLGIPRELVVAAGDHWNDLTMLSTDVARWLVAPANAIDPIKELVRRQNGYVSHQPHGIGVCDGLERILNDCPRLVSAALP